MNYGINIKYLDKRILMDKVAECVAMAGLGALDYTPDCSKDTWKRDLDKNMEIFRKNGLTVHQTHAPFNRYGQYDDGFMDYVERTLEATALMGAKFMVVHGDEFDFNNMKYTPDEARMYNYKLFSPIVDKAISLGIKIAFENVFEDNFENGRPRFCSEVEDLKALIEMFNSENVCCCWDFGHAGVAFGEKQPEKIRVIGNHIKCTHVHDCGHNHDLHLPPFLGDNDWDACMKAMKDINYDGDITFEMVYGKIPEGMLKSFTGYMKDIANTLTDIYEKA